MRIICDAPGQTCNRLWTYVASVAQCIVEKKKMAIIFFDWTIEDFPHLLHCPFIYFPLYHKRLLEHGNNWNRYKGLTWKATHNKNMDCMFRLLGCTKGWDTRRDTCYLTTAKSQLQYIFRPKDEVMHKLETTLATLRQQADQVVGVHIRRGDYATWHNGRFFYSLEQYHRMMLRLQAQSPHQRIIFFISSNEEFSTDIFTGCQCYRYGAEPSAAILDLYTLAHCDRIMGPFSTFTRWASFIGEVPLCIIDHPEYEFTPQSFSAVANYFQFQDGRPIHDW